MAVNAQVICWLRECYEKSDYLNSNRDDVNQLKKDEDEEGYVVARANARVNPRTVMIVPLNASLTDVAVVAPWDGNDLALEAKFIHFEAFQKLRH